MASTKAFEDCQILDNIIAHLHVDLLFLLGREKRQTYLCQLATLSTKWATAIQKRVYQNPFFGTAVRANAFDICLQQNPDRGKLIRKLVFGEGSDTDIRDWMTHYTVPNIISAAPNVKIIEYDGLVNIDLDKFKEALCSRQHLEELRASDLMPHPWHTVRFFFDEIISACPSLIRLSIYQLHSEVTESAIDLLPPPRPLRRALQRVALHQCSLHPLDLKAIFAGSAHGLQNLYFEFPLTMYDDHIVALCRQVGASLRTFTIHGYTSQREIVEGHEPVQIPDLVDQILEACPQLEVLDFSEALGSPHLFRHFLGSRLRLWSFTCNADVRPKHWTDAFQSPSFPRPASCRVYPTNWDANHVRRVRIEGFKIGVTWLASKSTLTELSEHTSDGTR